MADNVVIVKSWEEHQKEKEKDAKGILTIIFWLMCVIALMFVVHSVTSFSYQTSSYIGLGLFVILLFAFKHRKKFMSKKEKHKHLRHHEHHHHNHKSHNLFTIKTFLIYWLTYTVGFYLSTVLIPLVNTKNNIYIIFLLTGLILELSAKVTQIFIYKKSHIKMDKWFVVWVLLLSIFSFAVVKALKYLPFEFSNQFFKLVIIGLGITILIHVAWRIIYKK